MVKIIRASPKGNIEMLCPPPPFRHVLQKEVHPSLLAPIR